MRRLSVLAILAMILSGLVASPAVAVHDEFAAETLLIPWHHDGESFTILVGQPFEVGARWGACSEAWIDAFLALPDLTVDLKVDGPAVATWPATDWGSAVYPSSPVAATDFGSLCVGGMPGDLGWWVYWRTPIVFDTPGEYEVSVAMSSAGPIGDGAVNLPTGFAVEGTVLVKVLPAVDAVGLVDASQGMWHLRDTAGNMQSFFYGNPGDVPFVGDWDCDGNATPGLFRTSDAFAYLRNANSQGIADIRFFFGNPSDVPLAGDFNGDGCDTLSIYRPSEARFYIMNELGENEGGLGAADYSFLFGNVGDKPVVGDWDGDGVDEIGLHRETTGFFYYRNTLTTGVADGQFFFGDPGDRFVAGDWGVVDGTDTPAMFRPSNTTFYFRHTLTQGNADSQSPWPGAGSGWLPVAGDFTLD
jgi:hypothetical protein